VAAPVANAKGRRCGRLTGRRSGHLTARGRRVTRILSSLVLLFLVGLAGPAWARAAPVLGYRVIERYPHDRTAFTQGLLWRDGHLYESTG
jgi:hypothetical protein